MMHDPDAGLPADALRTLPTDRGVVHVFADPPALGRAAAIRFAELAQGAALRREPFAVALSGGSTPTHFHRALADPAVAATVPWSGVLVFFGDERAVGPDHPDSNFGRARRELIDHLPASPAAVLRMEGEHADLPTAARAYERALRDHLDVDDARTPVLDLVLLGLGEDGHTASLFPGTEGLLQDDGLVIANDVPQLDARRLTLTFRTINAARAAWFLVAGEAKAEVLRDLLRRGVGFPAASVHPRTPPVWWVDEAAARLLERT